MTYSYIHIYTCKRPMKCTPAYKSYENKYENQQYQCVRNDKACGWCTSIVCSVRRAGSSATSGRYENSSSFCDPEHYVCLQQEALNWTSNVPFSNLRKKEKGEKIVIQVESNRHLERCLLTPPFRYSMHGVNICIHIHTYIIVYTRAIHVCVYTDKQTIKSRECWRKYTKIKRENIVDD